MARANRASMNELGGDRSYAAGIARGAGVIAIITIGSRIVGLARTLTFSQTVGATCLGTAYVTANQVPNLVYELVLGGALSSVMVPLLARPAARSATDAGDKDQVSRITSALLTWCLLILVPLTVVILATAGPIAALLNPTNAGANCVHADVVSTTASMLRIFAPQALLYGLSVVLLGLLQAYRRFAAYALAPLVNSLVVIVPAWRLRLRLRPSLRLPAGIARRAGGLALVGLVEIVATEISAVVVIGLANGRGATGALVLFSYASQVFTTLNAVLALSISVSAFPVLAARDGTVFERACAGSTRAVVLVSCLGVALMAAVTLPAAHVLAGQPDQVSQLALGFACFAPGLVGLGVIANLARAMLAVGRLKIAAIAVAGSTLVGLVAQLVLTEIVPAHLVVAALAMGNTIGTTAVAIPLFVVSRRVLGRSSVHGVGRATVAGLGAAAGAGVVGVGVSLLLPVGTKLAAAATVALAACCGVIAFGVIALRLDDGDMRAILARVLQTAGLSSSRQADSRVRGLDYLSVLINFARQRTSRHVWMKDRGRMVNMNLAEETEIRQVDHSERRSGLLTLRERQIAVAIGAVAGGVGGYAVFASSNEAGTVLLLLISLIFLLVGVEGTPLLRLAVRPRQHAAGKRRLDKSAPRMDPKVAQRGTGVAEDIAMAEPMLIARPSVTQGGTDDANGR